MITLTLRDTAIKISGEINKALVKHINMAIAKNRGKVSKRFKNEVKGWLRQSPEINSLLAQGSPGAGNSAVDAIINSVVDSMQIKISKISPRYRGEILFNFQENSLGNILGLSEGHQITLFGEDLHWLNWLLTSGDAIVIKGFSYEPSKDGRSGGGTMKVGGSFRVPPEYAGVLGNNFITRAFEGKDKEIFNILTQLLV